MITIKEEFVGCDKYRRAVDLGGSDAIVMWLALKAYAAEHLTDGFIPDEDAVKLPGAPRRRAAAMEALQGCGRVLPDGSRGPGLVHRTSHGWQLHDYLDHAESADEIREKRRAAAARKAAYRSKKRNDSEPTVPLSHVGHHMGQPTGQDAGVPRARGRAPSPAQPSPAQPVKDPPLPPEGEAPAPDELQVRATTAIRDPMASRLEHGEPGDWPELRELGTLLAKVFGCREPSWRGGLNNPGTRAALERLAEGHSLKELRAAIRGAKHDEHVAEHPQFQTLQTILRDAGQVEKFARLFDEHRKPRAVATRPDVWKPPPSTGPIVPMPEEARQALARLCAPPPARSAS